MISSLVSKRAKDNPQYQQVNAISIKEIAYQRAKAIVNIGVISPKNGVYKVDKALVLNSEEYNKEQLKDQLQELPIDSGYLAIVGDTKVFFKIR